MNTYLERHPVQEMADSGGIGSLIASPCVNVETDGREVAWCTLGGYSDFVGQRCDLHRGRREVLEGRSMRLQSPTLYGTTKAVRRSTHGGRVRR